jgi:hypothetical protein
MQREMREAIPNSKRKELVSDIGNVLGQFRGNDMGYGWKQSTATWQFKWAGNQEAVTFLGYRPIRS